MPISPQELAQELGISTEDATQRLSAIDQAAVEASCSGAFAWSLWDKTSPINGCPANEALASLPGTPDACYLIIDVSTGQVDIFQSHTPGVPGLLPMTPEVAAAHAAAHTEMKTQELARSKVIEIARGQSAD